MNREIVVALDGMGGDRAPDVTVQGAVNVAGPNLRVLLVGDRDALAPRLDALIAQPGAAFVEVVHAPDKVFSSEDGARAVRSKPESSVVVACQLVRDGRAQGAVSLGHTGAMMAAATLHMRRIPGVQRPGIAVVLPSRAGFIVLVDAGANADARPEHLLQFAIMGRLFAQGVLGDPAPKVGLLSIGEEEGRGSELVQQATPLLQQTPGFIGNVEGRDIPRGTARVVVTDGFTGNVALKLYEGSAEFLFAEIRGAVSETLVGRIGGLLVRPSIRRMRHRLDPEGVGGAILLGVQGLAVIGHGSASPTAVVNAIHTAARGAREDVVGRLAAELAAPPASTPA
jgi:glycerol-3-phosphate acyltransferase PlsX